MSVREKLRGQWRPEVGRRLEQALDRIEGRGKGLAVFDFDNTCIIGDIGELFGQHLVEVMGYRFDLPKFWDLIHVDDGRQQLRELTEQALDLPADQREGHPTYRAYLGEMAALYGRRLARAGARDCYAWAVRLHVGLSPAQMSDWSAAAIRSELQRQMELQRFIGLDGRTAKVARGVRILSEIRDLIAALHRAGAQVWIVSATNRWTVQQFAPLVGVSPRRVLGNEVHVEEGRLTDRTREPALYREGKTAVIAREIGTIPDLVVGDAMTDFEMLAQAREISLLIDRGQEKLRREAQQRGWAVQPQEELTPLGADAIDLDLLNIAEDES